MNPSNNEPQDRMPDWYDPFAEPRTLPTGWDSAGWSATLAQSPVVEPRAQQTKARPASPLKFPFTVN